MIPMRARDTQRGQAIVARDHDDPGSGPVAFLHGVRYLGARRIRHRHEAEERQLLFHELGRIGAKARRQHGIFRQFPPRHRKHPKSLASVPVVGAHGRITHCFVHRQLSAVFNITYAKVEHLFGRAFNVNDGLIIPGKALGADGSCSCACGSSRTAVHGCAEASAACSLRSIPPFWAITSSAASVGSPSTVQRGESPFGGSKRALLHRPAPVRSDARSASTVCSFDPSARMLPCEEYPFP